MEVVLYSPDIPQNTGNIVRTCAATGTSLTLVRPLGFSLTDRFLKRSGLDYWEHVNLNVIDSLDEVLLKKPVFFSCHVKKNFTEHSFIENSVLVFGSETTGLPPHLFKNTDYTFLTIPMVQKIRCLNLSNCVAIALYEALRQNNYFKKKKILS